MLRAHKTPAKKAVNLAINSELLQQSKALRINLSKTLEQSLREIINHNLHHEWKEKNQSGIKEYNQRIEKHGVFSDTWRAF